MKSKIYLHLGLIVICVILIFSNFYAFISKFENIPKLNTIEKLPEEINYNASSINERLDKTIENQNKLIDFSKSISLFFEKELVKNYSYFKDIYFYSAMGFCLALISEIFALIYSIKEN